MVEKLKEQIKKGEELLSELKEAPDSWKYNPFQEDPFEKIENKIKNWQKFIRTLLKSRFKEDQLDELRGFEDTICLTKMGGAGMNNEFSSEVRSGINCLESLIERLPLINKMSEMKPNSIIGKKQPKVFISHSNNDKYFVTSLVDLFEFLGINSSELMICSSVDGYHIPAGKTIFDYLREQFLSYDLFVIFIHSHDYYESPISLNEMGAAWVLKTEHCSFLTPDFNYSEMKGVVGGQEIAIKVDEDNASSLLNDLKEQLLSFFNLKDKDQSRWEKKKKVFLSEVVGSGINDVISSNKSQFSSVFSKGENGTGIIGLVNEGGTVEEVTFEFIDSNIFFIDKNKKIDRLQSGGIVNFNVTLFETTPDDYYVTIHWKDAGKEKQEKVYVSLV